MEDQITDYLGKESEGASEDLLRNQKISLCNKRYGIDCMQHFGEICRKDAIAVVSNSVAQLL